MKNDSILAQIQATFSRGNRLAAAVGSVLGGVIPTMTFFVGHYEISPAKALYVQIPTYLVAFGMAFSALTVYTWAQTAFRNRVKAVGFVGLVEGVMIFSNIFALSCVALGLLVMVNGVATACNLVLDWHLREAHAKETKRQRAKPISIAKRAKQAEAA